LATDDVQRRAFAPVSAAGHSFASDASNAYGKRRHERMSPSCRSTSPVVIALDALPRSFHGDPADRLIVATARSRSLPLATHDKAIRRSRAVPLWRH
jgi:PIN domain nuclease of toxin-antitoxin system